MDGEFAAQRNTLEASPAADGPRLARVPGPQGLLRSPLGRLIARPWLDRLTLTSLRRFYFPLSRMWAAGEAADGSLDAYWHHLGQARRHEERERLLPILAEIAEAKVTTAAVETGWEAAFFGAADSPVGERVALETARHNRRDHLNKLRRRFLPLLRPSSPRAKLTILTPAAVAARTDLVADPDRLFAAPTTLPPVQASRTVPAITGSDHWLRFRSPSPIGDTVWARVHSPPGVVDPPTVIMGHGICVEFDHWHGLLDETQALLAEGVRVIRPEAPWHGRRRPTGWYGGEKTIATFPTGMVDHFVAALQEWTVLADWARRTSAGPLGFGGTSLGALTAQLAGAVAHQWPRRLQPDALYFVTHSGSMSDTALTGVPASLFGDPAQAYAAGWTAQSAAAVLALADPPKRAPVVDPRRIVSVIGDRDVITPFDGGETLVWRWNVPAENQFVSRNGHFTIPMRLARDSTPTRRFARVLRDAPPPG